MADKQEQGHKEAVQGRNTRLRESLSNAFAALQSEKTTQSFSAFTFEEALDNQIESIEGAGTQLRPNQLDRVKRILSEVRESVAQIKIQPPESFAKPEEDEDVNAPTTPET